MYKIIILIFLAFNLYGQDWVPDSNNDAVSLSRARSVIDGFKLDDEHSCIRDSVKIIIKTFVDKNLAGGILLREYVEYNKVYEWKYVDMWKIKEWDSAYVVLIDVEESFYTISSNKYKCLLFTFIRL